MVESDWFLSALTSLHLFFPACQTVRQFLLLVHRASATASILWPDHGREWGLLQALPGKGETSHIYVAHRSSLADVVLWIWLGCPDPYGGIRVIKGTEESYCRFKSGPQ